MHATRGKMRRKREYWALKVLRGYQRCSGCVWANVSYQHVVETRSLEGGRVCREATDLAGYPRRDKYGRVDLMVHFPGVGKVYYHQLLWYCFYGAGKFSTWKSFRRHCKSQRLDVDHGDQGAFRLVSGSWRAYLDVLPRDIAFSRSLFSPPRRPSLSSRDGLGPVGLRKVGPRRSRPVRRRGRGADAKDDVRVGTGGRRPQAAGRVSPFWIGAEFFRVRRGTFRTKRRVAPFPLSSGTTKTELSNTVWAFATASIRGSALRTSRW